MKRMWSKDNFEKALQEYAAEKGFYPVEDVELEAEENVTVVDCDIKKIGSTYFIFATLKNETGGSIASNTKIATIKNYSAAKEKRIWCYVGGPYYVIITTTGELKLPVTLNDATQVSMNGIAFTD